MKRNALLKKLREGWTLYRVGLFGWAIEKGDSVQKVGIAADELSRDGIVEYTGYVGTTPDGKSKRMYRLREVNK